MAEREQSSGFNPKHRVIGAVILVAAAVVIVPLVLNKREPPATDPKADGPTKTVIADVPPPGAAAVAPLDSKTTAKTDVRIEEPPSEMSVTQPLSPPTPAKSTEPPDAKPLQQSIAKKIPPPAKTHTDTAAKSSAKGWFLQVGTFSNPKNARTLADKLKHMGFRANTETVTVGSNKVVRVRIGPYSKDEQAKKAQLDLQKRAGINGIVGRY